VIKTPRSPGLIPRRDILKLIAATAALPPSESAAQAPDPSSDPTPPRPLPRVPTPSDPDLMSAQTWWRSVLTEAEMLTVTALADIILPADATSPAASAVGVPSFINEWVSAPYEIQQLDQQTIRGGLAWLNTLASGRFGQPFHALSTEQQEAVCDLIAWTKTAAPEHRIGALFFSRFRDLCATGYYTTPEGMKDIGYVGNVPTVTFDGPPPAVLQHLGLV
jgi:gluconate 2-dehydrogenase gamma chain